MPLKTTKLNEKERRLDDWIESYLEYAQRIEPPQIYNKWAAIATISAVLQRKCQYDHGPDHTFWPNFYIALVGRSGMRKSVAVKLGLRMLKGIGLGPGNESITGPKLLEVLELKYKECVATGTPEEDAHGSLAIYADELPIFLKPSKVDVKWFEWLTKLWDCPEDCPHEIRTGEPIYPKNTYLTVFGGITPDSIHKTIPRSSVGAGFTARVLFIWADNRKVLSNLRKYDTPVRRALYRDLVHDLGIMHKLRGVFHCDRAYEARWDEWYNQCGDAIVVQGSEHEGYNSRRGAYIMKLAMLHSASRCDGNMILLEKDFERSLTSLLEIEEHMPKVLSNISQDELARVSQQVMDLMRTEGQVSLSALFKRFRGDVTFLDLKNRILSPLVQLGICTVKPRTVMGVKDTYYVPDREVLLRFDAIKPFGSGGKNDKV